MFTEIAQEEIERLNAATPGGVVSVKTVLGTVVFKGMDRATMKRFMSLVRTPETTQDGLELACRSCVVFPAREEFVAGLELKPGIAGACSTAITELSGVTEVEVGKY